MRHYNLANLLLACALVSCAQPGTGKPWGGSGQSAYSKAVSKRYNQADYDSGYSLPAGSSTCMDDSPGCY